MIVREAKRGFLLVNQHDHGLVSGEFARRFSGAWIGEPLSEDALYAVSNHDIGWRRLDAEVLWNEEKGRPYSFVDYPSEPKMEAYVEGVNLVEAHSPYAALLCSRHYGSFVARSEAAAEARFREREELRRKRLEASLSEAGTETFERDFRLLQLCDDLSLFVCFNEPGKEISSWHKGGFDLSGRKFHPVWEEDNSLRFEPNPLSDGFDVSLPYQMISREGGAIERSTLELRITC